jgi:hypothetical protein
MKKSPKPEGPSDFFNLRRHGDLPSSDPRICDLYVWPQTFARSTQVTVGKTCSST